MSENVKANIAESDKSLDSYCQEILGCSFSRYQSSNSVNSYTGQTKADEVREALESYIKAQDSALKDLDIEDLNSVMYLEEIREQKELDTWEENGVEINPRGIPNIYDAMEIDKKVTAGEYLKSIPGIIAKLAEDASNDKKS